MEDEIDEVTVYLRSYFPESWMWQILDADPLGIIRYFTKQTSNELKMKMIILEH